MNRFLYILLFLPLLLLSPTSIFTALSQGTDIYFKHLTVEDGLSQSSIYCILQDSKGFMWFCTQNGLNKYDGNSFQIYKHNLTDTNSLSHNWIYAISEDSQGNLWIGTRSGLNKLERRTQNITRYFYDPQDPYSIDDNEVFGVYVDKKGYVWAKTSGVLNKLDPASGNFTHFKHHVDFFNPNKEEGNSPIIEDSEGLLWIGTPDGLNHFDRNYEQFHIFKHNSENPASISDNFVSAIFEDKHGILWVGTKNGLNKFNKKTKKFKRYFHQEGNPNSLSENHITSIYQDHNGNLWIGTSTAGLNKLVLSESEGSPKTEKFTQYRFSSENPEGISSDEILSIYEDKSEILWIGTNGGEINKVDMKKKKFMLYRKYKGEHSIDLSLNVIASFFIDNNILWIGTWGGGLDLYNRKTGEIKHFSTNSSGNKKIIDDFVHVIFEDSNGKIWLGTRNGINIYYKGSKKIVTLQKYINSAEDQVFNNNRTYCIVEDNNKNVWLGTEKGLHRINIKTQETTSYYSNPNDSCSLCNNRIFSLFADRDGFVWIGTGDGLNKYNPSTGKFHQYKSDVNSTNSLSQNSVYSLAEDHEGFIWIGTASGLNKLNKKDNTFKYFSILDDLIYEIQIDNNGNLWASTGMGLAMLNTKTEKIKTYDITDGLQGLEFNNGASYKNYDGELFFGGISGFNSFYPDSIKDNDNIPEIVLTSLEKINRLGTHKYFIEDEEKIVLSYKDYTFTIEFAALEYTYPEKNNYMYMMQGLRDEWTNIGNRNFVTFTDIPAGEYIFKLIGSNNDMVWNPQEASIMIIVKPHWAKTVLAYILYGLTIVSLIFYFIQIRTRKLRNANQILREKQLAALEIAKQKEELTIKNKSITDSINYARRIQKSMLPSEQEFQKLLPHSFVLFKPRDIVSGDFYWITKKDSKTYVAAVDCTGHGVPGAFMSIIGFDLLQNITKEQGIEKPAEILKHLNNRIAETFKDNIDDDHTVKDGMDIALSLIDKKNNKLEFAGAYNPLYLIRNNEIIEIKANRYSVGMVKNLKAQPFDNHIIDLKENDMIYLFSDGYVDQFGGPEGKKLMYKQFRNLLLSIHNLPIKKQKEILLQNIKDWQGTLEQVDDILVIGFRI